MKNYKVTIKKEYTIDVEAINEEAAEEYAHFYLATEMRNGRDHYIETAEPEVIIYDVSNTDDTFNSIN